MIMREQRDARVEILLFLGIVILCGMVIRYWHEQLRVSSRNLEQPLELFCSGLTLKAESGIREGRGDTYIPAHLTPFFMQPLPVNQADAELLATISGIGPTLAQQIIETRKRKGYFQSPQDLLAVSGIGPARAEQLAPLFSFHIPQDLDK